jgi:hypothetical protein
MYSYYRDSANVLPVQNTGMMPVQNTGMMPMQNAGMMPMQNAGMMPMQNAGMMPMQNAGMMPMQNAGMMPMQNAGMMPMQNAGMMPMQNAGMMPMQNAGMMPMQNAGMMPMQNAGMMPYNQFADMPTEDLESLYPQTYNVIAPVVENTCDKWMGKHGEQCPSKEDLDSMVSDIYNKVESNVEAAIKNSQSPDERQFFGGGRRILRDFIGALLIGSLIRRRRRPFFGYPYGFYGGYPFY